MRAPASLLSPGDGARSHLPRDGRFQRDAVRSLDTLSGVAGVALFGGSFDPVHVAHLIVAEAAADALGCAVRFLPAREQPLKRGARAAHQATPEQRADMLDLATQGNARFGVERVELGLPTPSYTVRTLRALRDRAAGNRYTLLLGADAARDLAEWWEVEALPELADIVVFARPGASVVRHPLITRVIPVPMIDLSATQVRARVKDGRSIRYLVPDPVREYIAAHGLYLGA
ncbi:MAG: nicotinate (nicotinamide) nucleotide adenylyltransferase [Betaproteobacteria bacterium]|nr:MAG: nicotinate (nicotinamide) nucleotide adenylyltransferase [Betaproteobacteria bacterium]